MSCAARLIAMGEFAWRLLVTCWVVTTADWAETINQAGMQMLGSMDGCRLKFGGNLMGWPIKTHGLPIKIHGFVKPVGFQKLSELNHCVWAKSDKQNHWNGYVRWLGVRRAAQKQRGLGSMCLVEDLVQVVSVVGCICGPAPLQFWHLLGFMWQLLNSWMDWHGLAMCICVWNLWINVHCEESLCICIVFFWGLPIEHMFCQRCPWVLVSSVIRYKYTSEHFSQPVCHTVFCMFLLCWIHSKYF